MPNRLRLFADSVKNLGVDVIKFLDPTGVTSWGDAYDAVKHADDFGSTINAGIEVIGALPVIGKVGKVGKIVKNTEKVITKVLPKAKLPINIAKIPGRLVHKLTPKSINKLNSARNTIKGTNIAADVDDIIFGGNFKKAAATTVAHKSCGVANLVSGLLFPIGSPYNGWTKANDEERIARPKHNDVIQQIIYGNQHFDKYNKPIRFNGKQLTNTFKGTLYPADSIIADKKLRGTMQYANSENYYNTNLDKDIIDTHAHRLAFKDKVVRASDTFDFHPYSISGRLMNRAMQPTWAFPNSGAVTFVQEIPVTYKDQSDQILKTALKK